MMGGLTFYSPNINIFRDPRWGRGQETYGEDPFLAGRLGVAFITGLQGDDLDHPVVTATAKHYAVHSGPEPLRHGFDAMASAHDIEDTYLPGVPLPRSSTAKVKSIMCVYNAVNGVPGCASEFLLDGTLRDAWKLPGLRHRRLRRGPRRRDRPQVREDRRRSRGLLGQGRPRQRLHDQRAVRRARRRPTTSATSTPSSRAC